VIDQHIGAGLHGERHRLVGLGVQRVDAVEVADAHARRAFGRQQPALVGLDAPEDKVGHDGLGRSGCRHKNKKITTEAQRRHRGSQREEKI